MPALWPYLILAVEVVLFFRLVLVGTHTIPWDLRGFFLPHTYAIADALRGGELPLWDPSTYCGRPLLANIQMGALYPPVLLTAGAGIIFGLDHLLYFLQLNVIGHILAAGIFSYWLGLALGLSRTSSLLLGTVFQLGGFFASHASHMTALQTAVWFPFALWAVLRERWLALTAGLAMSVLAGLAPLTAVVYALAGGVAMSRRRAASFALAAAGSVALALAQLVPAFELTNLSIAQFRADYLNTGGGVPLPALASLIRPNYHGVFDLATYRAPFELTYLYLYCGLVPLGLALFAVTRRSRLSWTWAALTALFALEMLGDQTPIGVTVMAALPVKIRIGLHPEYVSSAFTLCLAVLAAIGLEAVKPAHRGAVLALAAAELIAVSSGRPMNAMPLAAEPGHSRREFNGQRETLETVRVLTHRANPPWRIDTAGQAMPWPMVAPMTQIPSANGNDPFALVRMQQARMAFLSGKRWGSYYEVQDTSSPVLSMMNVKYLITGQPVDTAWPLKAEVPGFRIHENPHALPRFWLVARTVAASSEGESKKRLTAPGFDPSTTAIVETGPVLSEPGEPGSVEVVRYGFNTVRLKTSAEGPRYLVTSEAYYPGWTATVDGQPAEIHVTNLAFRGLFLSAGRHHVEMRFRPWSHIWPGWITGLAWIVWALTARRKRC